VIRRIIQIDENLCNGCEECAKACHEGAIEMVNGKARLVRDDYCDGLGDCLPACPTGAISFVEREAAPFDRQAVMDNMARKGCEQTVGCPGRQAETIHRETETSTPQPPPPSRLAQWPVQIKLAPVKAAFFDNANLLIAADCTAYAFGDFHNRFMKNRVTIIGCPKLDGVNYSEKLGEIIRQNEIRSVTVVRMQVPCCAGLENAVKNALKNSQKMVPWQIVTITADGRILED
jgi:ferredoxin